MIAHDADPTPPHGIERPDDVEAFLDDTMHALTEGNKGRPIRCLCGCGVTYTTPAAYFLHASRRNHPSVTP